MNHEVVDLWYTHALSVPGQAQNSETTNDRFALILHDVIRLRLTVIFPASLNARQR